MFQFITRLTPESASSVTFIIASRGLVGAKVDVSCVLHTIDWLLRGFSFSSFQWSPASLYFINFPTIYVTDPLFTSNYFYDRLCKNNWDLSRCYYSLLLHSPPLLFAFFSVPLSLSHLHSVCFWRGHQCFNYSAPRAGFNANTSRSQWQFMSPPPCSRRLDIAVLYFQLLIMLPAHFPPDSMIKTLMEAENSDSPSSSSRHRCSLKLKQGG